MNEQGRETIGVLGAGSWGTALARHAGCSGFDVRIWAYEDDVADAINRQRENTTFLPGATLPDTVTATTDFEDAIADASIVLSVVPSHVVRSVWGEAGKFLRDDAVVVSASKGIEQDTMALVHEVIHDVVPGLDPSRLAALSGPSFAREVAEERLTAVAVASSLESAERVQRALSSRSLRVYTTEDVVGVEVGGALKNVMAIAVGTCDGLDLGTNARAALITRGLAEMTRVAVAKGGDPLTLAGLAGVGDLVLTCTGALSRNRGVGEALGRGETLDQILGGMRMVAEGVKTTRSARDLGRALGVEMPITEQVYAMLYEGLSPRDATARLMQRDLKAENEFSS